LERSTLLFITFSYRSRFSGGPIFAAGTRPRQSVFLARGAVMEYRMVSELQGARAQEGEGAMANATRTALTRFSTHLYQPSLRFPVWLDCLRRFFGDVQADASAMSGFDAWLQSIYESDVVVTRMCAGAQRIEHRESPVEAEHRGFMHVVFPLAGCFHIEQGGHSVVLEPGDWGVYDLSRSFRSLTRRPVELLVLAAPRAKIFNEEVDVERIIARRFSCRAGGARIVKNLIATLFEEQKALSPVSRHGFAMAALQLVRLNILELAQARPSGGAKLRQKVQAYITDHLRSGDLSIEAVAASCGCSRRYIHKMFSASGQTAGQYILQSRLTGSSRDLTNPELAHLTITDIAVSWGFNGSSTFSRAFRKHFKISPRAYRNARPNSAALDVQYELGASGARAAR
jgi:AraC-like DNA-binding protein